MPPEVAPRTARTIRIEDIDGGVKNWFDRSLNVHVTGPQGDRRKVAVTMGGGERWVAAADRQGIRDRDGRLILPIIQIRRTGTDSSKNMTALGANVPKMQISRQVAPKTSDLANLDLTRPISERRLRDSAVYDIYTVPFPATSILIYSVRIQAQYLFQMNEIIEKMMVHLEFFNVPSFVISLAGDVRDRGISKGEGSTEKLPEAYSIYEDREPLKDYYVVGYIDGDLTDESNIEEFTDQERIIELKYSFRVPVALMLDPDGDRPAVQRERTAFGFSLFDEVVHLVESPEEADRIFGRRK